MAYIHQVRFEIPEEGLADLDIGKGMQRTLAYLKALLPSEEGHVNSRALRSIEDEGHGCSVVFESEWISWDTLKDHERSELTETKVLEEFSPHLDADQITITIWGEVGSPVDY